MQLVLLAAEEGLHAQDLAVLDVQQWLGRYFAEDCQNLDENAATIRNTFALEKVI